MAFDGIILCVLSFVCMHVEAALWLAALLVGGGVGGLFAGFIGQVCEFRVLG